jgi:hypothetical protein
MTPTEIAYSFVEAINSGDPDQLVRLMPEDHTFIDSDGRKVDWSDALGWSFKCSPTCHLRADHPGA